MSWANKVTKKNTPDRMVPTASIMRIAPARSRLRSSRTGISAWRLRASMTAKAASRTTPAVSAASTLVSPQWEVPSGLVAALDRP